MLMYFRTIFTLIALIGLSVKYASFRREQSRRYQGIYIQSSIGEKILKRGWKKVTKGGYMHKEAKKGLLNDYKKQ